jgi:hypothetical protein
MPAKAPASLTPAAKPPQGAKTIPLQKPPGGALSGAAKQPGATGPLPKSTVQLQKTQPVSKGAPTTALKPPSAAAAAAGGAFDEEEEFEYVEASEGMMPLAVVVLVLAVVLLAVELLSKMSGT